MPLELGLTAPSSGHSGFRPVAGLVGTAAASLRTIAPAFFLYGSGAVVYVDATPAYYPLDDHAQFSTGLSSGTASVLDIFKRASIEQLVIAKLDSIFEELLATQQDLDHADHSAIASKLWQLYK